jgi:hypothetical protein
MLAADLVATAVGLAAAPYSPLPGWPRVLAFRYGVVHVIEDAERAGVNRPGYGDSIGGPVEKRDRMVDARIDRFEDELHAGSSGPLNGWEYTSASRSRFAARLAPRKPTPELRLIFGDMLARLRLHERQRTYWTESLADYDHFPK